MCLGLYFGLNISILPWTIIQKFRGILSVNSCDQKNSSKASSDTPRLLQAWCHSVTLSATHPSAPLNTHYTFYNMPRPLSAHYHAYNNPQQLLVLKKH